MQVDNSTCDGIMNRKIQQNTKRQWTCGFIRREIEFKNFNVFSKPVVIKLGDSLTRHHLPTHHTGIIPVYLHYPNRGQAYARVWY